MAQSLVVNPAATALTVTPDPLNLTVRSGESASVPLEIANPSTGAVDWNLELLDDSGRPDTLEGALAAINASGTTLNGPLPNRLDFTEGETGTAIATGVASGTAIFAQGNKLTTNLGGPLSYSNNMIATAATLGAGGRYFTRKLPGLFIFGADLNGVSWFEVAGAFSSGQSRQTSQFSLTRHGKRWNAFVAKTAIVYGRNVNHLILIDQDGLTQSTATAASDEKHRVADLTGKRRLYYLMFTTLTNTVQPDAVFEGLAVRLLDTLPVPLDAFLKLAPAAGSSPAAGAALATASADAFGMLPGSFAATLKVKSPTGALLTAVPVSLEVTAPRLTVPATVNHATVSGVSSSTVTVPLVANLPDPQPWSATLPGAPAWVSLVASEGTTPTAPSLRFSPGTLAAGTYQTTLRISSGPATFEVLVVFRIDAPAIAKFLPDPARPVIYAINRNGVNQGQLVVIDAIGRTMLRTLAVGKEPTDLDFTEDGTRLMVINSKEPSISVIDLATCQLTETIPLLEFGSRSRGATEPGAHLKCGKGNLVYYVDEQWGPRLRVFNTATRTVLQTLGSSSGSSPDTGNNFGYGDLSLNPARTQLFAWAQYGDGAGFGSTFIVRFNIAATGALEGYAASASYSTPNFARDPLDTPVLFTRDGSRLIIKDRMIDQAHLDVFPNIYLDEIYSLAPNGSIAVSAGAIHDVQTAAAVAAMPVSATVQALLPDLSALVYFNTTTKTLGWVDLEATLGAGPLGLAVFPGNGSVVMSPNRLQWPATTGSNRYQIYLGTNQAEVMAATPGAAAYLGETPGTFLDLTTALPINQRYYWRVVPIGAGGVAMGAGTVRSFATSSFLVNPTAVSMRLPLGIQPQPVAIAVTGSDGQPAAWSLSESLPWFTPAATTGTAGTPLTGMLVPAGLAAGTYSGSLSITAGGMTLDVPISVVLYTPDLVALKADPSRAWVYGLHRGTATAEESQLLAIRAATGTIERVLPVGSNAYDFSINPAADRLYVSNKDKPRMQVVDLAAFSVLPPLAVASDIQGVAADRKGRLFVNRMDAFEVLDAATGSVLANMNMSQLYYGQVDPAGRNYYVSGPGTNVDLIQFDVTTDTPVYVRTLNLYRGNSERHLLSPDGTRLFSWSTAFDSPSLTRVGSAGESVKSTVSDGSLAIGAAKIWWSKSGTEAASLPFTAALSTVSSSDEFLVLYNATTRTVSSVRLAALVPFPGLYPVLGEALAFGDPTELAWPAVPSATSYRIFLGTTQAAVLAAVAGSPLQLGTTTTTHWTLTTPPAFGQRYFWRVDAITPGGVTKGAVWWFDVPMPAVAPPVVISTNTSAIGTSLQISESGLASGSMYGWEYHALRVSPDDGHPIPWQSTVSSGYPSYASLKYALGEHLAVLGYRGDTLSGTAGATNGTLTVQALVKDRWQTVSTVGPPSAPSAALLGSSVVYDGNLFMAGMPGGRGRVAVYREWPDFAFMQEFQASDGFSGDNFGAAIAMQGSRALIGAPAGWTTNGRAYIFEFQPGSRTWVQQASLVPPAATGVDYTHGAAVALDGDLAVLGTGSSNVNQVNVFTRASATSWPRSANIPNPTGGSSSNGFGYAVALAGDILFVSDPTAMVRGSSTGVVYVFHRTGSTWRIGATITSGFFRFGASLAVRNGVLYVASSKEIHSYRIASLVNRTPRFTSPPPTQLVVGRSLDLTVSATDPDGAAGLTIQSEVLPAGLSLQDSGAGQAKLTGTPAGAAGATHFLRWSVADPAGARAYQTAVVTMIAADALPVLTLSPASQTSPLGSDVILSATATGIGPLTWQWSRNGQDLPGATGTRLFLNEISAAESGTYAVRVANVVGQVTSNDAVVTVRAATLNAGDWATYGNSPAHHGHHAAALDGYQFAPAWTVSLGASFSQAAIANGRVHVGPSSAGGKPFTTLDLTTGAALWTFAVPSTSGGGGGSPAVQDGRVYFQYPGVIRCLNAATGTSEWQAAFAAQGYYYGPPVVTGEGLFAINGYYGYLYGYELTGTQRLVGDLTDSDGWSPAVHTDRLFTWLNSSFREHSPGDGSTLWSVDNLAGRAAFAVRSDCAVLAGSTALSGVDLSSRSLRWQVAGAFRGMPAIGFGRAYAILGNAVNSYSLADGVPGLVYQTDATVAAPLGGQAVLLNDRLLISSEAKTWIFKLADGQLLQTLNTGGALSYSNGYLLAAGGDGILRAFLATPLQRIVVEQPAGTALTDGASTVDFSMVLIGQSAAKDFTIRNTGAADLTGIAVTIDGTAAGDFTVSTPPAATVAPGGSTTFTLTFAPAASGTRDAGLHLASNDPAHNPFDLTLSGQGNHAPVFAGYALSTKAGQMLSIQPAKILARASDADGDAITLTRAIGPSAQGGTVALTATVNYTPPAGLVGTDSFEVELTDARGATGRGTLTLTVTAAPAGADAAARNLTAFSLHDGIAEMVFRGIPGRSYIIQRSPDLTTWSDLATVIAGADGKIALIDLAPPLPQAFYRTRAN
ncbi:MAG: choice-of-anchor D domain-containing protein [Verrucomicrobia bacterium]|nr:choice-of-anchor D domain-containing protein [Verrucomicrobiota bacterium]